MVRVLTDRFLGQIEIGQIGRVTYPAFGFDEGSLVSSSVGGKA
jgi:hypothetical protein